MVQHSKKLHKDTIIRMRKQHKGFLDGEIPFSTDIEKMGIHRAPVLCYAKSSSVAAKAYRRLWDEMEKAL